MRKVSHSIDRTVVLVYIELDYKRQRGLVKYCRKHYYKKEMSKVIYSHTMTIRIILGEYDISSKEFKKLKKIALLHREVAKNGEEGVYVTIGDRTRTFRTLREVKDFLGISSMRLSRILHNNNGVYNEGNTFIRISIRRNIE